MAPNIEVFHTLCVKCQMYKTATQYLKKLLTLLK